MWKITKINTETHELTLTHRRDGDRLEIKIPGTHATQEMARQYINQSIEEYQRIKSNVESKISLDPKPAALTEDLKEPLFNSPVISAPLVACNHQYPYGAWALCALEGLIIIALMWFKTR